MECFPTIGKNRETPSADMGIFLRKIKKLKLQNCVFSMIPLAFDCKCTDTVYLHTHTHTPTMSMHFTKNKQNHTKQLVTHISIKYLIYVIVHIQAWAISGSKN